MSRTPYLRSLLAVGVSAAALAGFTTPAYAQGSNIIEELVVTAQKKEESIQDVPIA
ncbi:MAG: hypothetical protein IT487_17970, partial [Chromatiaceae bacterium]|nr:hypothetical protein [Chromatiaceae bacterium]